VPLSDYILFDYGVIYRLETISGLKVRRLSFSVYIWAETVRI